MRKIRTVILVVCLAVPAVYACDWIVWKARMAMGNGMGTVAVGELIITPLKGNKEEYDWGGTADVDCSRSMFPHAGSGACWWLRHKKVVYEQ